MTELSVSAVFSLLKFRSGRVLLMGVRKMPAPSVATQRYLSSSKMAVMQALFSPGMPRVLHPM